MAIYKGRQVSVVEVLESPDNTMIKVQHHELDGTEVVRRGDLIFTTEEDKAFLKQEQDRLTSREKGYKDNYDRKLKATKLEADHLKEVEKAKKEGLPSDSWLETGTYERGNTVRMPDGNIYKSMVAGNIGNSPSGKSEYWMLMNAPIGNVVPQAKVVPVVKTAPVNTVKPANKNVWN